MYQQSYVKREGRNLFEAVKTKNVNERMVI